MEQVYGGADMLPLLMTRTTALALLVFCLLYTPCVAAIATIRRELGSRWAVGIMLGLPSSRRMVAMAATQGV